jgi:hypothetical protein
MGKRIEQYEISMNLPTELFFIIAGLVPDVPTYNSLKQCNKNSYIGCQNYKKHIMKKHDKIAVWGLFCLTRKYDRPLYYLTIDEFTAISKLKPHNEFNMLTVNTMKPYEYDRNGELPYHLRPKYLGYTHDLYHDRVPCHSPNDDSCLKCNPCGK